MARLPALMDEKMIAQETGLSRSSARSLMLRLEKVRMPGLRRVFVQRADVERALGLDRQSGGTT